MKRHCQNARSRSCDHVLRGILSAALVCLSAASARAGDFEPPVPTPATAMEMLVQGNARFASGNSANPNTSTARISETSGGQHPFAAVLTCSDSRVAVERLFDRGVGDVFVMRVAGNVTDDNVQGSAEYAVGHLHVPLLMIMGHTKCGAIATAVAGVKVEGSVEELISHVRPAVEAAKAKNPRASGTELIDLATKEQVWRTMESILGTSRVVQENVKEGRLKVVGAIYDVQSGLVQVLGDHPNQGAILGQGISQTASEKTQINHASNVESASTARKHAATDDSDPIEIAPRNASIAKAAAGRSASTRESKVASGGEFVRPVLMVPARPDHGAAAIMDVKVQTIELARPDSLMFVYLFAGAAFLGILGTLALAFLTSKSSSVDGVNRRSLTVGAKLWLGFGSLTTIMLGVATFATWSQRDITSASVELHNNASIGRLLEKAQTDVMEMRVMNRGFMLKPTDERLTKFSSVSARVAAELAYAKTIVNEPASEKLVSDLSALAADYDKAFVELVGVMDQRAGIIQSQMNPAAKRTEELLAEIARTSRIDGDAQASVVALNVLHNLMTARLDFFKFQHSALSTDADAAKESIRASVAGLDDLRNEIQNPVRKMWLSEAAQAMTFYSEKLNECVSLTDARDQIVGNKLDRIGPLAVGCGSKIREQLEVKSDQLAANVASAVRAARVKIGAAAIVGVLVACVMGSLLVSSVAGSIRKVLLVLQAVANNDLLQQPINSTSKDELGELARATDKMAASLRDVLTEVSISTTEVSGAATEIAASAEEMSASVGEVARQCAQAADSALRSGQMATEGGEVVRQTVKGMQEISSAVDASAQSVMQLGERGKEIGKVISVINDIADQTNLLALNAAIEAARAGEHGRGFAVVADEVRKLAERTTKATEEVAASIKSIQDETRLAVDRMEKGTQQVSQGVALAGKAGENLQQIVKGAEGVAGMIQNISAAAEEAGAGATQSATAAVQLSAKAEQLMGMVQRFKIDTGSTMRNANFEKQPVKRNKSNRAA